MSHTSFSDFSDLIDSITASLGGSPTAAAVEAAAHRILSAQQSVAASSPPHRSSSELVREEVDLKLSLSLASCTSRRSRTQRAAIYDTVRRVGNVARIVADELLKGPNGPSPSIELSIRDFTSLLAGHSYEEIPELCASLETACVDAGIDTCRAPFLDLSLPNSIGLLTILPDILSRFSTLHPIVQIGTDCHPPDSEVILGVALAVGIASGSVNRASSFDVVNSGCDRRTDGMRLDWNELGISVTSYSNADTQTAEAVAVGLDSLSQYHIVPITNLNTPESERAESRFHISTDLSAEQLAAEINSFFAVRNQHPATGGEFGGPTRLVLNMGSRI